MTHNILVTGIRGFIGFNAIMRWIEQYPENTYVGLDADTYADKFLETIKNTWLCSHNIPRYVVNLGEDTAESLIEKIVVTHNIDMIINFAAESHVDNSINNPTIFFKSNVLSIVHILNVAKKYGIRVHHVSTDEVIGSKTPLDYTKEDAHYDPSSPYSSSKASAELVALSYFKTFGSKITISRCTNNFGEFQMTEKFIPTIISKALNNEKIPVYGQGLQRRFWIDVNVHNEAIMQIAENGSLGEIYNISPKSDNLMTNIDMVKTILAILGKPTDLIQFVKDRPAHDNCYYLDSTKIETTFGFKDSSDFMATLTRTVDWYVKTLS